VKIEIYKGLIAQSDQAFFMKHSIELTRLELLPAG